MRLWGWWRKPERSFLAWPNQLYAAKGEVVVCCGQPPGENMHPIVTFACDIVWGQTPHSELLTDWQQEKPPMGAIGDHPSLNCSRCSAPFWQGGHFHFREGWR